MGRLDFGLEKHNSDVIVVPEDLIWLREREKHYSDEMLVCEGLIYLSYRQIIANDQHLQLYCKYACHVCSVRR